MQSLATPRVPCSKPIKTICKSPVPVSISPERVRIPQAQRKTRKGRKTREAHEMLQKKDTHGQSKLMPHMTRGVANERRTWGSQNTRRKHGTQWHYTFANERHMTTVKVMPQQGAHDARCLQTRDTHGKSNSSRNTAHMTRGVATKNKHGSVALTPETRHA